MKRSVYNRHSDAQIFQKSRWMALGMIASAKAACRWLTSSRNRFRVTDETVVKYLTVAQHQLEAAEWILRYAPRQKP